MRLENQPRTGSWFSINNLYSDDDVTHDVFTLWLDHGIRPGGASYSYIVAPGVPADEAAVYAAKPPVTTVANTSSIQAVLHTGLNIIGAVFYEPGSVEAAGTTFTVDKPCILLARITDRSAEVTLSNPENKALSVNVAILSRGKAAQTERFDLPGGMKAGSGVTRTITVK